MKKILLTITIIAWILIIYFLSSNNYFTTNNLSYATADTIITITNKLNITNISPDEREFAIIKMNYPLRKIAHVIEYFILSVLIYNILKYIRKGKNNYLLTFIICFIFALADEYHQTLISGRTGQFSDCLIDMIGCIICLSIAKLIKMTRKKH